MVGITVYVVIDNQAQGDDAVIGARLTPEEAEALRQEVATETVEEMEFESDEDRAEAGDDCDTRYEIIDLVA